MLLLIASTWDDTKLLIINFLSQHIRHSRGKWNVRLLIYFCSEYLLVWKRNDFPLWLSFAGGCLTVSHKLPIKNICHRKVANGVSGGTRFLLSAATFCRCFVGVYRVYFFQYFQFLLFQNVFYKYTSNNNFPLVMVVPINNKCANL